MPPKENQTVFINASIYLVTLGIIMLFIITSIGNFNNPLLQALFPKPQSFAAELAKIPTVELTAKYQNQKIRGVLNIDKSEAPNVTLNWQTTGNPTHCYGWSSGRDFEDQSWQGEKDLKSGSFKLPNLNLTNAYVYTIECSNQHGDAQGDSITINIAGQDQQLDPYITDLNVYNQKSQQLDSSSPVRITQGEEVKLQWESLNVQTPLSVCVSSGSWPTKYHNMISSSLIQKQQIKDKKVYYFTIFCSNEKGFTKRAIPIVGD